MKILCLGSCPNVLAAALLLRSQGVHQVELLPGGIWGGLSSVLPVSSFDPELGARLGLPSPSNPGPRSGRNRAGQFVSLFADRLEGDHLGRSDQERWPEFVALMERSSQLLRQSYRASFSELASSWQELEKDKALETLRLPWQSLRELLNRWFEDPLLKATLAGAALIGTRLGPFAPGTTHHLLARWARGEVLGAARSPLQELKEAILEAEIPIISGQVQKFQIQGGLVRSALSDQGTEHCADTFLTSEDPITTCVLRVGHRHLGPELNALLAQWQHRCASVTATLPAAFQGSGGVVTLVEDLEQLEQAADAVKYGQASPRPFAEWDPGSGRLLAQHAASDGSLGFESLAQDYRLEIDGVQTESSQDREQRFGLGSGHLFGGETALWQSHHLRDRLAQPLPNLLLCGASTGPGDYTGLAGELVYQKVQKLTRV